MFFNYPLLFGAFSSVIFSFYFVWTWFSPFVFDFSVPSVYAFVHLDFVYSGLDPYSSYDPCMHFYIWVCFIQIKLNWIYILIPAPSVSCSWQKGNKLRGTGTVLTHIERAACLLSNIKAACYLLREHELSLQSCAPRCSYIETRKGAIAGRADGQEGWWLWGRAHWLSRNHLFLIIHWDLITTYL